MKTAIILVVCLAVVSAQSTSVRTLYSNSACTGNNIGYDVSFNVTTCTPTTTCTLVDGSGGQQYQLTTCTNQIPEDFTANNPNFITFFFEGSTCNLGDFYGLQIRTPSACTSTSNGSYQQTCSANQIPTLLSYTTDNCTGEVETRTASSMCQDLGSESVKNFCNPPAGVTGTASVYSYYTDKYCLNPIEFNDVSFLGACTSSSGCMADPSGLYYTLTCQNSTASDFQDLTNIYLVYYFGSTNCNSNNITGVQYYGSNFCAASSATQSSSFVCNNGVAQVANFNNGDCSGNPASFENSTTTCQSVNGTNSQVTCTGIAGTNTSVSTGTSGTSASTGTSNGASTATSTTATSTGASTNSTSGTSNGSNSSGSTTSSNAASDASVIAFSSTLIILFAAIAL